MYADLPRPTVFAHRGSSAHAPENTLAAFELAITQGAPAIELDAKLCADGHVVVIHDQSVDRTTSGAGLVRQMPLAALKELDAGSFFSLAFKGEKIPTLEEVFAVIGRRTFINVEITNYTAPWDDLPDRIVSLVKKFNLADYILFSSFNPIALLRARRLLPQVPAGLLAVQGSGGAWARGWLGRHFPCQALHPEIHDVTPELVHRTHNFGRRVHVYTVNQAEEMARLFNLGVDGIFTDDPPLALQVLSSFP